MTRACWLALALLACAPKAPVEAPAPEPITTAPAAPEPSAPTDTPAPAADTTGSMQARIDRAAGLIEKGSPADLEQAIQILEPAASEDPTGIARLDLGLAYQKRGDLSRAANQYQSVIATHPELGAAWLGLASIQQLQGQRDLAASNVERGIAADPENVELRVVKINVLREQGKLDAAIAEAKAALKINAKSLGVYNAFGLCYLDQGDLTLARFIFQKAVQEIPGAEENAFLQTNLGWAYYLDQNVPQATFHLKKAVEIDPDFVPALVYLSKIYMEDHNYGDTVALLENAARLDPKNADIQLTLGLAYRGVGRLDDAEKAYRQALSLAPDDPRPHFNLAVLIGDYRKDYDGAINEFSAYIAAGGPERDLATQYVKDIQREKELSQKRAAAEEERKRKEEERKQREAEEAAKAAQNPPEPEQPAPEGGEPTPEGGEPTPDGAEPTQDGAEPTQDGAEPTQDGGEAPPETPAPAPE